MAQEDGTDAADRSVEFEGVLEQLRVLQRRVEALEARDSKTPLHAKLQTLRGMTRDNAAPERAEAIAPPAATPLAVEPAQVEPWAEAPWPVLNDEISPPPVMAVESVSIEEVESVEALPPALPGDEVAPPVMPYRPAEARAAAVTHGSLEQTIGLKWAGWIGAVVLVIGAGLGIKFAYDQGWLGGMPATVKLLLLWLSAFGLIGAGEYVYRRVSTLSAAGLYGAGVAVLFLVSYAGHGYFGLYARDTAFVLMGLSTLVGSGIAVRGRLVSIAVLSLIGGHLAPLILRGDVDSLVPFLSYLAGLQIVAVVLAWWGATPTWHALRPLSLAAAALWMTSLLSDPRSDQTLVVSFLCLYAALYQGELVASAFKRDKSVDHATEDERFAVVFAVVVTTLFTVGLLTALRLTNDTERGAWVIGLAAAHALLGWTLTGRTAGARESVYALAIAYRCIAVALLIAAVPVALAGASVPLAWGMMAVALAAVGRKLDLPIARRAAAVTWALAVGALLLWACGVIDSSPAALLPWATALGHAWPAYWFTAVLLTLAGHAVARLSASPGATEDRMPLGVVVDVLAGAVFVVATIAAVPTLGATALLAAYAWLLFGADYALPGNRLTKQAAAVVGLGIIKWVTVDLLADRLSPGWSAAARSSVFNPVLAVGALLTVTAVVIGWLRRGVLLKSGDAPGTLASLVLAMITIGLSFEIDRQFEAARGGTLTAHVGQLKHLAWTMLWALAVAAQSGIVEFIGRRARSGFELLAAAAVLLAMKFVIFDTLAYRVEGGPVSASAVANFQRLAAAVVVAVLLLTRHIRRAGPGPGSTLSGAAGFAAMFVLLWLVSFEIDAYAPTQTLAAPWAFRQVGWSVCWSLFAVVCVGIGFVLREAPLRYFGLALFGATLLKVTVIDLSAASTGYRILSFIGLGALLLGTSVLYGKVSPLLLKADEDAG